MNLEQLAMMGIAIFGFMAVVHLLGAVRTFRKTVRTRQIQRVRRLVSSAESARAIANSVVNEVAQRLPEETEASREQNALTEKMDAALAEARAYYLGRVEPRYKTIFTEAVDEIILLRKNCDVR